MARKYSIGLDFGTESVRAVVVSIDNGAVAGQHAHAYARGVIDQELPGTSVKLPADYALQHPQDWLDSAAVACKDAMRAAGVSPDDVVGIGGDFTSCTMLPCLGNGTPLCLVENFKSIPLAWPKLWKHHGAKAATDRINQIAAERREPWLARYGGTIGLEWFFPKILETITDEPTVYDAAEVWVEAGDWFVWQLSNGPFPKCALGQLARSTCQAGYKAMWNAKTGYPSADYFAAVNPKMKDVVARSMPGALRAPGQSAGILTSASAELLGLRVGTPVSAAIIDAHAGVAGAGVAGAGTMVLVMGTSSCHMLNSDVEKLAPGIAGVVQDGILPGFFGYETGQASVGDAFAWFVETFGLSHEKLNADAAKLNPGSGGVMALDWLNGCRTPLMDGRLSGAFVGVTLGTRPEQMYRALMEATAFGVRWIVDTLVDGGVPVNNFVASGGLPIKSPLLMQIYADVLGRPISMPESDQSVALGAAILGCLAAGREATGHVSAAAAVNAMARQRTDLVYQPNEPREKSTMRSTVPIALSPPATARSLRSCVRCDNSADHVYILSRSSPGAAAILQIILALRALPDLHCQKRADSDLTAIVCGRLVYRRSYDAITLSSVTQILHQIERGEAGASEKLLPLVYEELRGLAARNIAQERNAGHDATSLVHEAYMRMAGADKQNWNSRGHFYAAAAEAMRRILIDDARRRRRPKHGGDRARVELNADVAQVGRTAEPGNYDDVLAIDEALTKFAALEPAKAQLVKMRYFGGLSLEEAASAVGISLATAKRHWAYARAWLFDAMNSGAA